MSPATFQFVATILTPIAAVAVGFIANNARQAKIETLLDGVGKRLDGMDKRLDRLENGVYLLLEKDARTRERLATLETRDVRSA